MSDAPFDEEFDTMMEVQKNPTGAFMAIQAQARRIEELEAHIQKILDAEHVNSDLDDLISCGCDRCVAMLDARAALPKGTEDA